MRGKDDGKVLRCMCVQIRVLENHQNGKDTHVRGVQLFARDERARRSGNRIIPISVGQTTTGGGKKDFGGLGDVLLEPEWANEPEIR